MGLLSPTLPADRPNQRQEGARRTLLVLTAIQLLNFVDRYVPSSVKAAIEEDLGLSDTESALPTTGMTLVYMVFSVLMGTLADKNIIDRRVILAVGIVVWSIGTSLAGAAWDLKTLVLFRCLVGVGEAAYGTVAGPLIADLYPQRDRNAAYTLFFLAIPVGGALGFGLGGVMGALYGWRTAFYVCGIPGLFAAYAVLHCSDPARGVNDAASDAPREERSKEGTSELLAIVSNPHYMVATAGLVCTNFALGGLADWISTFMLREQGISLAESGITVGATTVVGGLVGTLLGSAVAGRCEHRVKSAFFLVPALFTLAAAFFTAMALNADGKALAYASLLLAGIFQWTYISPISTLSVSVMPVHLRARSAGVQIFLLHILGDVISPPIIGQISDRTGSLRDAMQITWVFILLSGLFWAVGCGCLPPLPTSDRTPGAADGAPVGVCGLLSAAAEEPGVLKDDSAESEEEPSESRQ